MWSSTRLVVQLADYPLCTRISTFYSSWVGSFLYNCMSHITYFSLFRTAHVIPCWFEILSFEYCSFNLTMFTVQYALGRACSKATNSITSMGRSLKYETLGDIHATVDWYKCPVGQYLHDTCMLTLSKMPKDCNRPTEDWKMRSMKANARRHLYLMFVTLLLQIQNDCDNIL